LALVAVCVMAAGTLGLVGASMARAQGPDGYSVYYVAPGGDCGVASGG